MLFAYLTTDEVNQASALEFSSKFDAILMVLAPKDGPADRDYDAFICDWDSWPADCRATLLQMSSRELLPVRGAVHGYNLTEQEEQALLSNGLLVCRALGASIFRDLCEAGRLSPERLDRVDSRLPARPSFDLTLTSS